jgi:hypothetical protein
MFRYDRRARRWFGFLGISHCLSASRSRVTRSPSLVEVRTLIFFQAVRSSSKSAGSWSEMRRSFALRKNRQCDGVGSCFGIGRWSVLVIACITYESPYSQAPTKPGKPCTRPLHALALHARDQIGCASSIGSELTING